MENTHKKGFTPILVVLIMAIITVVGYFAYKNFIKPSILIIPTPASQIVSEVIVPNEIDRWIPKVNWDKVITSTEFSNTKNADVKGISRKGTILNPDKDGNPYNIEDLLPDINKKLENLGWKSSLPVGASGPTSRLSTYYKDFNGVQKMLKLEILVNSEAKCPCVNTIMVFQEQ